MKEVWKIVPGYSGYYFASNLGRIRSIERTLTFDNRADQHEKAKILNQRESGNGYLRVCMHLPKEKQKHESVHRIIALTFLGKPPKGQTQVNHKDGNKLNNRADNLEWSTAKENMQHASKNRLMAFGERNWQGKLTTEKVARIRKLFATGKYTQTKLAPMFGVSQPMIGYIVRNEVWM